jgi:hypothetical protein
MAAVRADYGPGYYIKAIDNIHIFKKLVLNIFSYKQFCANAYNIHNRLIIKLLTCG